MNTSGRQSTVVSLAGALLLALGAAAGLGHPAAARPAGSPRPTCAIVYIYGQESCYAPAQVAQAERQVPFALRPSRWVAGLLHLHLSQVDVWRNDTGVRHTVRIDYLYGRIRGGSAAVRVAEDRGRGMLGDLYLQSACGTVLDISPARFRQPANPRGPWYLVANFPRRDVTLSITAKIDQPTLKRLACAILRADSAGPFHSGPGSSSPPPCGLRTDQRCPSLSGLILHRTPLLTTQCVKHAQLFENRARSHRMLGSPTRHNERSCRSQPAATQPVHPPSRALPAA